MAVGLFLISAQCIQAQGHRNIGQQISRQQFAPQRMAAGAFHNLEIRNGKIFSWGYNTNGQLGDGTQTTTSYAVQAGNDADWVAVDAGFYHSMALKANGTLWGTGYNVYGQLGDGTNYDRHGFTQTGKDSNWVAVACGLYHTLAIKSNGTLWAFGFNSAGELGDSSFAHQYKPVQITKDSNWVAVCCGRNFSMGLKADGSIWCWGSNDYGQLGDGNATSKRGTPYKIAGYTAKAIAAGSYHGMALLDNGRIICWGQNTNGQLGNSSNNDSGTPVYAGSNTFISIAAGNEHSFGISSDGNMWSWGFCSHGQLGQGNFTSLNYPKKCSTGNRWVAIEGGEYHSLAVDCNGKLYSFGRNNHSQLGAGYANPQRILPDVISDVLQWNAVSGFDGGFVAIRSDGTLWSWGNNQSGQLGDGTTTTRKVPVQIGNDSTWVWVAAKKSSVVALRANGTLWAWGKNDAGQLGIGSSINQKSPVQIGGSDSWMMVYNGGNHMIALRSDGTLWTWGANNSGQLGDNSTNPHNYPIQVGTSHWRAASAGDEHSLAISVDGKLYAWGSGKYGQNAAGAFNTNKLIPYLVDNNGRWLGVECGNNHSLAMRASGTLLACGSNDSAQLGNGNTQNQNQFVGVQNATNISMFVAGAHHSAGIAANGKLRFWGTANNCEFGNPYKSGAYTKVQNDSSAMVLGFISCGVKNTAILKPDRNRICIAGSNVFGQLGTGSSSNTPTCAFDCNIISSSEIHIVNVQPKTLCMNDTLKVSISTIGNFDQSNTFSIIFSDSSGNFGNISTIKAIKNIGDTLLLCLPDSKLLPSKLYKIRIESAVPNLSSQVWNTPLTYSPAQAQIYSHPSIFCAGNKMDLFAKHLKHNTYTWKKDNAIVKSSTDTSYSVLASGNYSLVCTGLFGCADSTSSIFISESPKPTVKISTVDSTHFCAGSFATLSSNSNPFKVHYQWFTNGTPIAADTNATLIAKHSGKYSLSEQSNFGCTDSSASLTISEIPPPHVLFETGNLISDSNDQAMFVVQVDSNCTYNWQEGINGKYHYLVDGYHYKGSQKDSLHLLHVNDTISFRHYRCIVTSKSGCSDTSYPALLSYNAVQSVYTNGFIAYPVPFQNELHIHISRLQANHLEIWNVAGQLVLRQELRQEENVISTATWSPGVYMIRSGSETARVIKN